MGVTKRLRFEILRRDDFACRYCGGRAPDVELVVDHVTPRALGGTDTADNLVASCRPCNSGKSSASPDATHVAQVADDALRWAAAIKRATEEMQALSDEANEIADSIDHHWNEWGCGSGAERIGVPRPDTWRATIHIFVQRGLPWEMMLEAIPVTMAGPADLDRKWNYFCGVCWKKLEDIQALAKRYINEDAQ